MLSRRELLTRSGLGLGMLGLVDLESSTSAASTNVNQGSHEPHFKPRAKRVVPSTQPSRERIWCWESFFCRLLLLLSRDKDERDAKEIVVGCLNRSAVQVNNTIIARRVGEHGAWGDPE